MNTTSYCKTLALIMVLAGQAIAQTTSDSTTSPADAAEEHWSYSFATSGYVIPNGRSYASPILAADHGWLHLEARYNDEDLETGSLWAGYNLSAGHSLVLEATPMLGAVFGKTNGVAPGCKFSLAYKRVELLSEIEYVFDLSDKNSFLYSWNELVYSATDWFHAGLVSQRTRAYQTPLDVQRGFSVGVSYKKADFTTYIFNAGWTTPTVVLALGFKF